MRWKTLIAVGRLVRFAGGATLASAALALAATPAAAAAPCHPVEVGEGTVVRVATVGVPCESAREVAATYFERDLDGEHYDGKTGDGSIYYSVGRFRCFTGLGGSQMFCRHRNRQVFASSRHEDHPSTWSRPKSDGKVRFLTTSGEPIHRLGSSAARDYMRAVLSRFSFEDRAGGSIGCNRRISATRIACAMGWVLGDTGYGGRGQIWLTFEHHEKRAHFSYRLTRLDEYCAFVTHEGHCAKKLRDSGPLAG